MPTYLRVAAVEGRTIVHPSSIQAAQQHMIAHERYIDGDVPSPWVGESIPSRLPRNRYRPHGEHDLVDVEHEQFILACMRDGDLAYVEHVEITAAGERTWIDPHFAAVTAAAAPKVVAKKAPALPAAEASPAIVHEEQTEAPALPAAEISPALAAS